MNFLHVILFLFTIYACKSSAYDAESINSTKLIHVNNSNEMVSGRLAGYGLIKFEDQAAHDSDQNGPVTFAEDSHSNRPLRFEDVGPSYTLQNQQNSNSVAEGNQNNIVFLDDNRQNLYQNSGQNKRRKRRRKSRRFPHSLMFGGGNNFHVQPGSTHKPLPAKASVPMPPGPLRTVSDAFNSIVENDDKKCVSRMLCEQAATGAITPDSSTAKTIVKILQYIPVLQKLVSYNAFPLFKAVGILALATHAGQMSKNETVCRDSYPECPSDPEERLHYFNNHKGGLSRFFRGETQQQYTAQEFHNNLLNMGLKPHAYPYEYHNYPQNYPNAGQYGVYQPSLPGGNRGHQPYAYGLNQPVGPYGAQWPNIQNLQSLHTNKQPIRVINNLPQPNAGYTNPSQPASSNYGSAYSYYRRFNSNGDNFRSNEEESKDYKNEIQKRIQNKPGLFADDNIDDETDSYKWTFPKLESTIMKLHSSVNKVRNERQLKFPDGKIQDEQDAVKQAKEFSFPGAQSNRQYFQIFGDDGDDSDDKDSTFVSTGYETTRELKDTNDNDNEAVEIVYIVRGNGDPRQPEIVKLRPGEKIH